MTDQPTPHNGTNVVSLRRPAAITLAAARERVEMMARMCHIAAEQASARGLDDEADRHFRDAMALSEVLRASEPEGGAG